MTEHPEKMPDDDVIVASCGCRFWGDEDKTFYMQPCKVDCPVFVSATNHARRLNKPMVSVDLREEMVPADCPSCGMAIEGATQMGGSGFEVPEIGDLTMCIKCLAPMVFTSGHPKIALRLLEPHEVPLELNEAITQAKEYFRAHPLSDSPDA